MKNKNTKILLVSDNKPDISNIKFKLEESIKFHCEIWHCEILVQALDFLNNEQFMVDIVILDLGLVDPANPKEIYEKMGEATPDIPIIVLTGMGEKEHELATYVMEAGANDHMIRGQFSRLIDAIEFSIIRQKLVTNTADKGRRDQQKRQNKRNIDARKAEIITDEKHQQKDQFISWMMGGYSVEDNISPIPPEKKDTKR
jgi:CheY-like chemotaxis protein